MTGSLQVKNGKYYAVLNLYVNGKRKQKWINSNLPVKGNKTRAEKFLRDQIALYEKQEHLLSCNVLFSDYIRYWLTVVKSRVNDVTYQGYEILATAHILPYFEQKGITIPEATTDVLQAYFDEKAQNGRRDGKGGLSARSLKLHLNIIQQTLDEAEKNRYILANPCRWVELPSMERRVPTFYTAEQMEKLLSAIADEPLYPLIKITAFYGLRRSETLGLKWSSINFDEDMLTIQSTVVKVTKIVEKDTTKNASSRRSFPLIPEIRELLLKMKEQQKGTHSPYVFVWPDGRPIAPDYVTRTFGKLLKKYGFPYIRFHDLRHSCASILLSKGMSLKDVQDWLGHADIKMTSNVYGHLEIGHKKSIAATMADALQSNR